MKLQGAIFDLPGTLLDQKGRPLPGLEPFLTLMKLEDVGLYLMTEGTRAQAQELLARSGLSPCFKGILSAVEQGRIILDPELYRKAARRMDAVPRVTAVFSARPGLLTALKEAGFYTVWVGSFSPQGEQPDLIVEDYRTLSSGALEDS